MGRLTREQRAALAAGRDDPRWRPRKPRRRTCEELEAAARAAIAAQDGAALAVARTALVGISLDTRTTDANRVGATRTLAALVAAERAAALGRVRAAAADAERARWAAMDRGDE